MAKAFPGAADERLYASNVTALVIEATANPAVKLTLMLRKTMEALEHRALVSDSHVVMGDAENPTRELMERLSLPKLAPKIERLDPDTFGVTATTGRSEVNTLEAVALCLSIVTTADPPGDVEVTRHEIDESDHQTVSWQPDDAKEAARCCCDPYRNGFANMGPKLPPVKVTLSRAWRGPLHTRSWSSSGAAYTRLCPGIDAFRSIVACVPFVMLDREKVPVCPDIDRDLRPDMLNERIVLRAISWPFSLLITSLVELREVPLRSDVITAS